jgi:hypothetical protein
VAGQPAAAGLAEHVRHVHTSALAEGFPGYAAPIVTMTSGTAHAPAAVRLARYLAQTKEVVVFDLAIELAGGPDALAVMGEALGQAGMSIEGGAMFTVDGKAVAHFLFADGEAAQRVLAATGIRVTACREVLARRLDQETPGQLGAITRAVASAGVAIEVLYSDHDHRLILLTSGPAAAAAATAAWDR